MNFDYTAFQNKLSSIVSVKERAIALVEDTAGFYNLKNRGVHPLNRDNSRIICFYHAEENTPGCAIGRCLGRNSRFVDPLFKGDDTDVATLMSEFSEEFPNWLKEIDVKILKRIQEFHDSDHYWNDTGMTTEGGIEKDQLICFINDYYKGFI
jgi:hypothetical protein